VLRAHNTRSNVLHLPMDSVMLWETIRNGKKLLCGDSHDGSQKPLKEKVNQVSLQT